MRTCTFTGKSLSKENSYYNSDGTYMDVNVKQFIDSIPELPMESLELLVKLSTEARNKKLSGWQKFLQILRLRR
jgi:hypothetical protein